MHRILVVFGMIAIFLALCARAASATQPPEEYLSGGAVLARWRYDRIDPLEKGRSREQNLRAAVVGSRLVIETAERPSPGGHHSSDLKAMAMAQIGYARAAFEKGNGTWRLIVSCRYAQYCVKTWHFYNRWNKGQDGLEVYALCRNEASCEQVAARIARLATAVSPYPEDHGNVIARWLFLIPNPMMHPYSEHDECILVANNGMLFAKRTRLEDGFVTGWATEVDGVAFSAIRSFTFESPHENILHDKWIQLTIETAAGAVTAHTLEGHTFHEDVIEVDFNWNDKNKGFAKEVLAKLKQLTRQK